MVEAVITAHHHRTSRKFWDRPACPSEAHILCPCYFPWLSPVSPVVSSQSPSRDPMGASPASLRGFASPAVRRLGRDDPGAKSCISVPPSAAMITARCLTKPYWRSRAGASPRVGASSRATEVGGRRPSIAWQRRWEPVSD
jgi:hypothetical protein